MTRTDLGGAASARATADRETGEFEAAVVPLMPPLLAYFARRVLPVDDAADCLSETMIVLWRQRATLPASEGARRGWAFGIAKRVLANQRRGRIRQMALADRVRAEVRAAMPDSSAAAGDDDAVSVALDSLPERDRELVRLIVWDGFGVAEAGALLGIRAGAARTRYSRAKQRLRELLPE